MKYTLMKKLYPTDEWTEYGTYDVTKPAELKALTEAIFQFGKWMYSGYKLVEAEK